MKNKYIDNGDGTTTLIINSTKYGKHEYIIDSEDVNRVKVFYWFTANHGENRFYAQAKIGQGSRHRWEISLHRLITSFEFKIVDHANRNTFDNRKSNLRESDYRKNRINARKNKIGTSKYKGVTKKHYAGGVWQATITNNGIYEHIGTYKEEKDAALAYNKRAIEIYGEHAHINFVE